MNVNFDFSISSSKSAPNDDEVDFGLELLEFQRISKKIIFSVHFRTNMVLGIWWK
jgi:hypothetical protein